MDLDLRTLAEGLARWLAPALPQLVKAGDKAVEEVGKRVGGGAVDGLRKLWLRIRERPAAAEAVEDLAQAPKDSRLLGSFEIQLEKILRADGALAAELAASGALLVQGDGAAARDGGVAAGAGGAAVGRDVHGGVTIVNADRIEIVSEPLVQRLGGRRPSADLGRATRRYLEHLVDRYRYLEFKGMGVTDRLALRLPLLEMYVPLKARVEAPEGDTWARHLAVAGRAPGEEELRAMGERLSEPRLLLDLLQGSDGLVVLGDPGAGKSTFLKFLAVSLAAGQGEALELGTRLPVLLPLSAYADALAEEDVPLASFIARYYQKRGLDLPLDDLLDRALVQGDALLLFDGLDEVRDFRQRHLVVERVQDFYCFHRKAGNKLVLTSRIVGYPEARPQAEGLAECTLVDFDAEEIREFVGRWTQAVEKAARGTTQVAGFEAGRERDELLAAIGRNPGVRSLAANPLLLTILAVMKRQEVSLPERRVQLYQTYVETLLKHWNLARSLSGRSGRDLDVVETLKILPPLALWMHETSPGEGLVKEGDLRRRLAEILAERGQAEPEDAARRFLEDVREHAALLLDRGGRQYGFIHLTFQEYLAAVALARRSQQGGAVVAEALAAHVGEPAWHEVILLAIGYLGVVQQWDAIAGEVLEELIRREPGPPGEAVVLAGRAVADAGAGGVTPACRAQVVEALLATLPAVGRVEARQRVAAGRALADLGDPRPEVTTLEGMELCWVPAGPFRMGEEGNKIALLHECDLPYGYWIGRYPVTVAQFAQFVRESGSPPRDPDSLREPANQPVRWLTWQEALGFCTWLTERWRERRLIGADQVVTLPSEAEWEKAARGGLRLPARPRVCRIGDLVEAEAVAVNPAPGRGFPWGDEQDPERANFGEPGTGANAMGCFPGGRSPYGCEEMSLAVWEWTRSLWGKDWREPSFLYPYDPGDGREDWRAAEEVFRVVRCVRCAVRNRDRPRNWFRNDGFRLALLPFTSGL